MPHKQIRIENATALIYLIPITAALALLAVIAGMRYRHAMEQLRKVHGLEPIGSAGVRVNAIEQLERWKERATETSVLELINATLRMLKIYGVTIAALYCCLFVWLAATLLF